MITPNKYFDEIYCLNLKRRFDKWKEVQQRFQREQIFVKRIEGIDGQLYEKEYSEMKKNSPHSIIRTQGAYAILLSFIKIFKDISLSNYQRVLVFEDDVIFHKDFKILFNESVKNIPKDWDMWYLGASQYKENQYHIKNLKIEEVNRYFYKANKTEGFYAFGITREFAKEMLNFLKVKMWPADAITNIIIDKNKNKKVYVSQPLLCHHEYGFSDNWNKLIGKEQAKKNWFHRVYDEKIYH